MKTIIKIFICLSLIYTPMFANAAKVGGWNLSNPVVQGASTVYDATKNVLINGKDFVKNSWVKITPTASQVSKVLVRGGAGYALSIAVQQLLGSVDWVLDPENNRIIYKEGIGSYSHPWIGSLDNLEQAKTALCNEVAKRNAKKCTGTGAHRMISPTVLSFDFCLDNVCTMSSTLDVTNTGTRDKYLPLDAVSRQVISNANGGDTNAQVATTAAAADIVAEAQKDDAKARPIASQAEANAETKPADEAEAEKANEAQGQSKPNEANPEATDISLEFPVFCSWAPTICEAAQVVISFPNIIIDWYKTKAEAWAIHISEAAEVVISFPNTLTGWYNDTKTKAEEWATSISQAYQDFMRDDELPNDDTKVDITDIPTPELQENAISWGASCPADVSIPISMQGVSSTLVFSWSPWCQLLSIIKPAIVASAYIGAAFIVLGLRT